MRRAAQPRIVLVRAARECRRGRLRSHPPRPEAEAGITLGGSLELDEQRGIVITRQQPEQEPIGEPKHPRVTWPAQLEQTAVLGDGTDFFPPHGLRWCRCQQIRTPEPRVLLLASDRESFLVMQDLLAERGYLFEVTSRLGVSVRY